MILTADYNSMYEGVCSIAMDECSDVRPVDFSGYSLLEATYKILEEDATNWNNIIQSAAIFELQYLKENGVEVVYEEDEIAGEKGSWISKIVETIKSWLSKIMGMIQSAFTSIASAASKAIDAVKNLGLNTKLTNPTWPSGKTVKSINYFAAKGRIANIGLITDFGIGKDDSGAEAGVRAASNLEIYLDDLKTAVKKASGKDGTSCSAKDIKNYVAGTTESDFRGTGTGAYDKCVAVLERYRKNAEDLKKSQKEVKDTANKLIKNVKAAKKVYTNDSKAIGETIKVISQINAFNTNLVSAKLSIMMGEVMLARKIVSVFTSANKKSSKSSDGEARTSNNTINKVKEVVNRRTAKSTKEKTAKDVSESAFSRIPDFEIL